MQAVKYALKKKRERIAEKRKQEATPPLRGEWLGDLFFPTELPKADGPFLHELFHTKL